MAEINSESQFFLSRNIANMIPESPLNKMVPLMDDHMGEGGAWGHPFTHRLKVLLTSRSSQVFYNAATP